MFLCGLILAVIGTSAMTGCVNKHYVEDQVNEALSTEVSAIRVEIDQVRKEVKSQQQAIEQLKVSAVDQQKWLETVHEALKRANELNKLKKGRLLYEVTLSDQSVPFGYDESRLSEDAKAALDNFANMLIEENKDVYIEIQGHTDNIGSEEYNLGLGQSRADAVKAYLHIEHSLPLHRISAFSYGETEPVSPNDTEENRSKNRRVILVVME
jgi:outer membrane protein OmpA-like peptidoglycan-associated protein